MVERKGNGANLGFENQLWAAADKLRGHMDASEYKHVVLGLIFLKYISDAFQAKHNQLEATKDTEYTDPEDRDEYAAANIFWVPKEARWAKLQASAKQPTIGKLVDDAMVAIEKESSKLKGVLLKDYARPSLDKHRLGELIDLVSKIGLGDEDSRSKDILGRVYEYFLGRFADAEGRRGGEYYTPRCVVKLLVRMIEPFKGRVLDPCCGAGGMFVQSERFVEEHGGRLGDIAIYGQESNPTTWRLAMMNLAIRGLDANLGGQHADSFHNDLHKDLRADFILANPPFNMSDWGGERLREDARWKHGIPPANNANYAWIQHFIHHLSPTGITGFVMANGSMATNTSSEGEIRRSIIENDLVDCMIAMPGQLFYTTQIPVCLWFVARNKKNGKFCNRSGRTLFIDARKMGALIDRVHRDLSDEDIGKIAATYHAWRGEEGAYDYEDVPGFCKSATLDEIKEHGYVLTPGRYVGAAEIEDDGIPFEEKWLSSRLHYMNSLPKPNRSKPPSGETWRFWVMADKLASFDFSALVAAIRQAHEYIAAQTGRAVNISLTLRNWVIGCYIREYEQSGADRATYGENLLSLLSQRLEEADVGGCASRSLRLYRQFYLTYPEIWQTASAEFQRGLLPDPIWQTLSAKFAEAIPATIRKSLVSEFTAVARPTIRWSASPELQLPPERLVNSLSFSHFAELIAIDDPLKRTFYEVECIRGNWSVRELKRQIGSLYYERSGLSMNKEKLAELVKAGADQAEPKLAIRDPYIFEFLGIKPREVMRESDLEDALLDKLHDFLLELGHGFCFEARQKRILIGDTHGFVDLVFYHRFLKCHVLVELKVESFTHENLGQLNTYVSWYRKNMMADGDNPPVGILLCTQKDHALVEYAIAGIDNNLFVSKYQLELPKKEEIQRFLEEKMREVGDGE